MRWEYDESRVGVAWKTDGVSGDMGGLGEPLPAGCLAVLSVDVRARLFILWAYSPGGEVRRAYPLDTLPVEDAGPNGLATGRIDVTGAPALTYHDGYLKAFYAQWSGGQSAESLWRLNTGMRLV